MQNLRIQVQDDDDYVDADTHATTDHNNTISLTQTT